MSIGILEWRNESALSFYPFTKTSALNGFIVDASFLQFDGFIPTLKKVVYGINNQVTISLECDYGLVEKVCDLSTSKTVLIDDALGRRIGKLVFSDKPVPTIGTEIPNVQFLAHTVKSIPSKCGVFTVNGLFGQLTIRTDLPHPDITFSQLGAPSNGVRWQAVTEDGATTPQLNYLKTINGKTPINLNISINDSELIKITKLNNTLTFALNSELSIFSLAQGGLNASSTP